MAATYEEWARVHGTLPPRCMAVLRAWFPREVLDAVRVLVQPRWLSAWTRCMGMPAVTVYGMTLVCVPGVLDADGRVRGRLWSWTQPRGVALWAHEIKHVEQWRVDPKAFAAAAASGIIKSLLRGKIYDHSVIAYEQDAIAFERTVLSALLAQEHVLPGDMP